MPAAHPNPKHIHNQRPMAAVFTVAAIALAVGTTANAQSPCMAAPSTATSASSAAEKLGAQMVTFQGKEMSIVEVKKALEMLQQLKPTEFENAVNSMDDRTFGIYEQYLKTTTQATCEDNRRKEAETQKYIELIIEKVPQVVLLYEGHVAKKVKLNKDQKDNLEYFKNLGRPPEWMDRVQKLLDNPNHFSDR